MSNLSDKPWLVPGHMYQYDIGWLVDKLLSFETELNTAIDLKTIHYADPIQWDITTQYSPNTVVVDPKTGTAYMSKVPVPSGVLLTNTDYWVVIFNYQRVYDRIMSGVAYNDRDNLNATKDLLVNDLVWYGGDLYRATRAIPQGTTYIPGTNLTPTTIADCLATYYGRDRVAQVLNDTINVSGDYTLNAGDIAETASNVTIHSTQDMVLDADGSLTEQVTKSKTSEVGGKLTERITGSREIDVDGDDSVHVDGVTSINRGGAVTEVYGSSVDKRVTGAFTESFEGTATSNFNGKRIVKGTDVSATYTGGIDITVGTKTLPIKFPDKTVDLYALSEKSDAINLVTIGDSYGTGEASGVIGKNTPWTSLLQTYLNPNLYYTKSQGGAGLLTGSKTFLTLLNEVADTITDNNKLLITHVLLAGGYNDKGNTIANNSTALQTFISRAKSVFPNATVYIACIGWSAESNVISAISNNVVPAYTDVGRYGACYINNINYAFHKTSWFDDLVHPNQDGQNYITSQLINGLLSGSADVIYPLIKFKIGNVDAGYCTLHNDTIQLMFDKMEFPSVPTPSGGNPVLLGTLDNDYINAIQSPTYNSFPVMFFMADITGSGTKFINGIGIITINGKNVYFTIYNLNDGRDSFYTFTQPGTLTILPSTVTLSSAYC